MLSMHSSEVGMQYLFEDAVLWVSPAVYSISNIVLVVVSLLCPEGRLFLQSALQCPRLLKRRRRCDIDVLTLGL